MGKILLIVGGIFLFLGILVIGGLVYTAYLVKDKVVAVAEEYGVNSSRPVGPPAKRTSDVCSLLSKEEAAEITGVAVDRAEAAGNTCSYFGSASAQGQEGGAQATEAIDQLQKNAPNSQQEAQQLAEKIAKGLGSQVAGDSGGALFRVEVSWGEARGKETGLQLASKAMGAGLPVKIAEPLSDVGDRAYLAPMASAIYVVKGDTWVEVDGRALRSRDHVIAVAQKVVSRM